MSEDAPYVHSAHSLQQPLTTQPNGISKQSRSRTFEGRALNYEDDQGYLAPSRLKEGHRQGSTASGTGSDPDSVLEYYNQSENRKGSRSTSQNAKMDRKKQAPAANRGNEGGNDESYWIHRDKLAQIEIKEMEEAGFKVGRSSRSNSRSASASRGPRDRKNSEAREGTHYGEALHGNHRIASPIASEPDEDHPATDTWDPRTQEEISTERELQAQRQHTIRPSTSRIPVVPVTGSRIPVAKTSPLPVGHAFGEGQTRSRKGSSGWNGETITTNGLRERSGSISSQVLLDGPRLSNGTRTPPDGDLKSPTSKNTSPKSPVKGKAPAKSTPGTSSRKTSAQRSTSQSKRTASGQSPVKRPGTSGGISSRPTTSHRPEGEAPWIATMYKPDPRLPPDQQIIPTHARRMQQEQWENEGKVGSAYDREFRLLNTEQFSPKIEPEPVKKEEPEPSANKDDEEWPLPSPTKPTPPPINTNLKSPVSEQGGYKLTPTVAQGPRIPSRTSVRRGNETTITATRVPEQPVEAKEKKGCGLCIVM